jgi:glyoxylase-like metal-dependent hydrolase (beta-lactamase superfamily II)
MRAVVASVLTLALLVTAWWGREQQSVVSDARWTQISPGVWKSAGLPAGYALIEGERALLIGAGREMDLDALKSRGVKQVQECLLTHHHRDSTALAGSFAQAGIRVRAAKVSAEWLSLDGVRQFWNVSLPVIPPDRAPVLRDRSLGIFAYLMHPVGIEGVDCSLEPGQIIEWNNWKLEVLATPGHSRDHVAYVARRSGTISPVVFCGDAFATPGTMWTPYTLDWDHWTDSGTKAAAESLRKMAALRPGLICPEHAPPLTGIETITAALNETAQRLDAAGFLKSYERFTKERLGNPPEYAFLAPDQVATAGEKPWTKLSEHLYLSGNTYVLSSRTGGLLVVDPFGPQIAQQITKLQREEKLGAVEVVFISHAHNDHYTGAFLLPERNKWQVWTLDAVARPISNPFAVCAPYVDTRALDVDKILKDGEVAAWHEYQFQIGHFPGQTLFTMGIQTSIDGKKCYFTADNFFHANQFSGSGGWSGRNRAWPLLYSKSAQSVLDAAPDWVLAEHGGAFAFSTEDFRRRVQWSQETARAMDGLSPSSQHRHDWNPTRITVEPMLQRIGAQNEIKPGPIKSELILENTLPRPMTLQVELSDRGLLSPFKQQISIGAGTTVRQKFEVSARQALPPGRHVFTLTVQEESKEDPADIFFVIEN